MKSGCRAPNREICWWTTRLQTRHLIRKVAPPDTESKATKLSEWRAPSGYLRPQSPDTSRGRAGSTSTSQQQHEQETEKARRTRDTQKNRSKNKGLHALNCPRANHEATAPDHISTRARPGYSQVDLSASWMTRRQPAMMNVSKSTSPAKQTQPHQHQKVAGHRQRRSEPGWSEYRTTAEQTNEQDRQRDRSRRIDVIASYSRVRPKGRGFERMRAREKRFLRALLVSLGDQISAVWLPLTTSICGLDSVRWRSSCRQWWTQPSPMFRLNRNFSDWAVSHSLPMLEIIPRPRLSTVTAINHLCDTLFWRDLKLSPHTVTALTIVPYSAIRIPSHKLVLKR